MRVAFVLRHITEKGSSKYAVEVIKYMQKNGHDVHVFANKWDKMNSVHFHKIPVFSRNFFIREFLMMALSTIIVNLQRYKFNVVYSQPGRFFSPDIAGVHMCATGGIGNKPKNIEYRIWYEIEKFNLKKAKRIIAVSDSIKNELMKNYSVPEEKITVIHNGVNLSEFSLGNKKNIRLEIRKKYNIGKNEILLLFVGNPFSRKGLEYLLRALPFVKNVKLLIIGRYDDITPYLKLSDSLGVRERVLYMDFVDKISDFFASSDIFVFPTLYEPFGLVVIEAMASGLPVVVSKCAGAAELIEDGNGGILLDNPKNPEEIAEKVNMLIKNKRLRSKISKQARKVVEEYAWDKVAEKWLEVFEEIK